MRLRFVLGVTGALLAAGVVGCASEPRADAGADAPTTAQAGVPGAINDSCPITTDSVDPAKNASWRGVTIGFCCNSCVREFRESDEKGKDEILAKARSRK